MHQITKSSRGYNNVHNLKVVNTKKKKKKGNTNCILRFLQL